MRKCEDCQIILDSDVRFCPKCGKPIAADDPAHAPARGDVTPLLASANLHRLRQEWDAAVNYATEALKLEPTNPDATSMLADIYEQRAMLDDALIWCRMTLELDPTSAPEKARLDGIIRKRSASGPGNQDLKAQHRRIKIGAVIMTGLMMIVVIMAIALTGNRDRTADLMPIEPQPQTSALGPRISDQAYAPSPANTRQPMPGPAPSAAQPTPGQSPHRTPSETKVISDLQSMRQSGVNVTDAIDDPRQHVLVLTYSVPVASISRNNILAGALDIARAAFASNPDAKYVTARCIVPTDQGPNMQIAFVGDISRPNLDALGAAPAPNALANAFTGQWWNPQIR